MAVSTQTSSSEEMTATLAHLKYRMRLSSTPLGLGAERAKVGWLWTSSSSGPTDPHGNKASGEEEREEEMYYKPKPLKTL